MFAASKSGGGAYTAKTLVVTTGTSPQVFAYSINSTGFNGGVYTIPANLSANADSVRAYSRTSC